MSALAPAIFGHSTTVRVSTRNGKIILTFNTRNIKILNTPLNVVGIICPTAGVNKCPTSDFQIKYNIFLAELIDIEIF